MCEFLGKLASDNLIVVALISNILVVLATLFPAFAELSYAKKRWLVFGLCLVVPLLGLVASVQLCAVVFTVDLLVAALSAGCAAFASNQLIVHLVARAADGKK